MLNSNTENIVIVNVKINLADEKEIFSNDFVLSPDSRKVSKQFRR